MFSLMVVYFTRSTSYKYKTNHLFLQGPVFSGGSSPIKTAELAHRQGGPCLIVNKLKLDLV